MFLRQKKNKSGSITIQLIEKSRGKSVILETIGTTKKEEVLKKLVLQGQRRMRELKGQIELNFGAETEESLVELFVAGIQSLIQVGPNLVLGKLFDEIGFDKIDDPLFRFMVINQIVFPGSKLGMVEYANNWQGVTIGVDTIYRYMDTFGEKDKIFAEKISLEHSLRVMGGTLNVIFYDVTTLYFESERSDELRKTGFSKDGKHSCPQILLGLIATPEGYPIGFDIYEGNTFEGHTLTNTLKNCESRFKPSSVTVVADAGMFSKANIKALKDEKYTFILGGRVKNATNDIRERVLALKLETGQIAELEMPDKSRLIVSHSEKRAKKDAYNRKKGYERLKKGIKNNRFTKEHINNRGYNKYLVIKNKVTIEIDEKKYKEDAKWDGLKSYVTNSALAKKNVVGQYQKLWKIERAFRISKTDLKIRPIYHRKSERIKSHIAIAFCAYKVYVELERQLKLKGSSLSAEKAIEILKTIHEIKITMPHSFREYSKLIIKNENQQRILDLFNC